MQKEGEKAMLSMYVQSLRLRSVRALWVIGCWMRVDRGGDSGSSCLLPASERFKLAEFDTAMV